MSNPTIVTSKLNVEAMKEGKLEFEKVGVKAMSMCQNYGAYVVEAEDGNYYCISIRAAVDQNLTDIDIPEISLAEAYTSGLVSKEIDNIDEE